MGEEKDTTQNERVEYLREQVSFLRRLLDEEREARRRADMIIAQLARANDEQARAIRKLEAPSESPPDERRSPNNTARASQGEQLQSASGEAQAGIERPQQRSGWLAPVEKLPSWQHVLGAIVVFALSFSVPYLASAISLSEESLSPTSPSAEFVLTVAIIGSIWLIPGLFGLWVGFKRRLTDGWRSGWLRAAFAGLIIGIVSMLGLWEGAVQQAGLTIDDPVATLIPWIFLPTTILYVSGELIGNAWQWRRAERAYGEVLARSASGNSWTPRSQAMLGFAGTIIAAMISLAGTVITVVWGGG